jgi:PAS domain S-box-containing protein
MELKKVRTELRQSALVAEDARLLAVSGEARLQKVLDCLPQGIVLVDEHNKFVLWNKNYENMFHYMADHLKPGLSMETAHRLYLRKERHLDGLTIAEENEWIRSQMEIVNRGDTIIEQNISDGRWIRYDQHLTPEGGKICVRSDITDDRNAAESFHLLFESNPVPMWLVEKATLKFIDVNSAALRHYGYAREQFLKMTTLDIRPSREHERALADVKNDFHTETDEADWIHLKADGTEILVSSFAKQIKYNGKDAAIIGIVDVTERRKQDARIKHFAEHCVLTGLPNR